MKNLSLMQLTMAILVAAVLGACSQANPQSGWKMEVNDPDPTIFADNAFPPVLPDDDNHRQGVDSWMQETCLNCHASGRNGAPEIVHEGMSSILLDSKCRSCHTTSEGNG